MVVTDRTEAMRIDFRCPIITVMDETFDLKHLSYSLNPTFYRITLLLHFINLFSLISQSCVTFSFRTGYMLRDESEKRLTVLFVYKILESG